MMIVVQNLECSKTMLLQRLLTLRRIARGKLGSKRAKIMRRIPDGSLWTTGMVVPVRLPEMTVEVKIEVNKVYRRAALEAWRGGSMCLQ
jgi:hypothetical protein